MGTLGDVVDHEVMGKRFRLVYSSEVSDEEWVILAPSLALFRENSEQRNCPVRDIFDELRNIAKSANQWRFLPNDLPPWTVVNRQMRRWMDAR